MPKKPVYDENTIILSDRIYIPREHVDERLVEKNYVHLLYEEAACRRCPLKSSRHAEECDTCEHFLGSVKTYNEKSTSDMDYYGIPIGDRANVERLLRIDYDDFNIVDKRVALEFDYDVKLRKLVMRDYQDLAAKAWSKRKYGFIIAPPRSGKTPLALYISVRLGVRTMLLAGQHEFVKQFNDHVEKYTNLPALEKKHGVKLWGIPKTLEDFETIQIGGCTYQQFFETAKGKERFKAFRRNFGNIIVDEADKSASNEFARVINNSPAKFKSGVTGTFERKDGRHKIAAQIIGPVNARVVREQLKAKLIVHVVESTKSKSAYKGKAGFTYCCKFLANHKKRMEMILEFVGRDLEAGHSIIIPVYFKDHVFELVKRINDLYGVGTAEYFVGGAANKAQKALREQTLERAISGKTRVIVGIRSLLQRGLNVPRWSALYNIMPINNEPNWKQESSRVLTPWENKRQPVIRFFVDSNIGLSLGCFAATYKQSLEFGHIPTDKAAQQAVAMMKKHSAGRRGGSPDGEIDVSSSSTKATNYTSSKKKKKKEPSGMKQSGLFGSVKNKMK